MNAWVALVAVVAAVNPLRRWSALRAPLEPAVAAAGAGIAWLAALVLAAVSDTILDRLSISAPNAQIAAGLVLLVRALVDVVLPPGVEPVAGGGRWRAAFPVAFPQLVRPEVALLMLAGGVVLGIGRTAFVAAAAYAATALALSVWRWERGARVLAVATSVAGVAAAVDIVIDGVLAV